MRDLTQGSVTRHVLHLAVFMAVSNRMLLHREFRRKLTFGAQPRMAEVSAAGELG